MNVGGQTSRWYLRDLLCEPTDFWRARRDSRPRLLPPEPKPPARIASFSRGFGGGAKRHWARRGSFNPPLGTGGPERHRALCSAHTSRSKCIEPRADPCQVDSQGSRDLRGNPAEHRLRLPRRTACGPSKVEHPRASGKAGPIHSVIVFLRNPHCRV